MHLWKEHYVSGLSVGRSGARADYFDQTCLMLGKCYQSILIGKGHRSLFCAVQRMGMSMNNV